MDSSHSRYVKTACAHIDDGRRFKLSGCTVSCTWTRGGIHQAQGCKGGGTFIWNPNSVMLCVYIYDGQPTVSVAACRTVNRAL